jgi:hypothetical protein
MIKPIVYHSFQEKEILERSLMAAIPKQRKKVIARALMRIFYGSVVKHTTADHDSKNDR